jgi:DNA-binding NtrC family response regulator
MARSTPVLLSWIAVNNDPFERNPKTGEYTAVDGQMVHGPTFTLLFDESSPFAGRIRDVVLLHREAPGTEGDRERRAIAQTREELRKADSQIRLQLEAWKGDDPTDHRKIYDFLRERLPSIRQQYAERELVIHTSPGTPSMQTIWVLMAETGMIEAPFTVVKSYRRSERRGRPAVVPVELGLETFFKAYQRSLPAAVSSEEQRVVLDPRKFRSQRMKDLFREAHRFAQVKVPVLILGERGTGKTTLAGWIRSVSPYRKAALDNAWPAVPCGQYNEQTMRSELFGYLKGSFTGATKDTTGLLDRADGDTLFLDEIGDVSCDLQRLLIRAVEEGQFLPVGSNKPRKSDFRLLSATNLDEAELAKRLDPDFRDRVSYLTLRLPPLREIPEELDGLWRSAFDQARKRSGVRTGARALSEADHRSIVQRLEAHPLPGNIRDLLRVAYRLVAAIGDRDEPLPTDRIVEYGLDALEPPRTAPTDSASREVARAFADGSPLDAVVAATGQIRTREITSDLQSFIACEVRRMSDARGCVVEDLCDVGERTLRNWVRLDRTGKYIPPDGNTIPSSRSSAGRRRR